MIVLNKSKEKKGLDLKPFAEMLNGSISGLDVITGKKVFLQALLEIDSKQPMIIELD